MNSNNTTTTSTRTPTATTQHLNPLTDICQSKRIEYYNRTIALVILVYLWFINTKIPICVICMYIILYIISYVISHMYTILYILLYTYLLHAWIAAIQQEYGHPVSGPVVHVYTTCGAVISKTTKAILSFTMYATTIENNLRKIWNRLRISRGCSIHLL